MTFRIKQTLIECTFAPMNKGEYSFLSDGTFTLPYKCFGKGEELLLCFHGFGRSADDFQRFEAHLGEKYTLIAFDFLYHGPHAISPLKRLPSFTPADLSNLVEKILWDRKKVRCSLMGYSQGGKTVMGLVHKIPHRIHALFVLAPDGMKKNSIRSFISKTVLGRKIGLFFVNNPALLHQAIKGLYALHFIPEKVKIFFITNTNNLEKRYKIYHTWMAMRKYEIHPHMMDHYFHVKKISVDFFIGRYDAIIPLKSAEHFLKQFQSKIDLHIMECGHDLFAFPEEIAHLILRHEQ